MTRQERTARREQRLKEALDAQARDMAHLHFKRTVYKSGGTQAKARITYITRETPQDLRSTRHVRYIGRPDREDLVYTNSRNLPPWADGNSERYFRAAEQYERANGI